MRTTTVEGGVMSVDFDPRDLDSRERDDGIHDREDEWLTLGRGPGSAVVRDGDEDVRERDDDWREERDRAPPDPENDVGSLDPRDGVLRGLGMPAGAGGEVLHQRGCGHPRDGSESRAAPAGRAFPE